MSQLHGLTKMGTFGSSVGSVTAQRRLHQIENYEQARSKHSFSNVSVRSAPERYLSTNLRIWLQRLLRFATTMTRGPQMRDRYREETCYRAASSGLILCALSLSFSATLCAQQTSKPASDGSDLPDKPDVAAQAAQFSTPQSPNPLANAQSAASIGGRVFDINKGIVVNAQVTLEALDGTSGQVHTVDSAGFFWFRNLEAGTFGVRIIAAGFEPFESSKITLHEGERFELPNITLPIAVIRVEVNVVVTEEQLAWEQVHVELRQRILGLLPNFYTSFIWNAAPLKPKLKFELAFRSATDPVSFLTPAVLAAVEQARNTYSGYGQGADGYAKRYGGAYGDLFIGHMIGGAILPSILHQDPRYFYQGTGTSRSRMWHAVSSAFICRGDNGHLQFNYSHFLGNLAAGGISNLYRPDENRGAVLAFDNALLHSAALAGANLVREFALRRITTKVPVYAQGKPQPVAASSQP